MAETLIQIVPRRSVASEGVGDYARLIAEAMREQYGVVTKFVACTPLPPERRLRDEWETVELARRHPDDLAAALDPGVPVLLHLSGYGYHRKGVPLWVAAALRRRPSARLATVFHELYATGPIWSSPFWLGWAQKLAARRIYEMSDGGVATTGRNVKSLRSWVPRGAPLALMPCFSTIGEPRQPPVPAMDRPATLAVFARAGGAEAIYGEAETLAAFIEAEKIGEVIDIGARASAPPARIGNTPVRVLGELPAERVSEELARARFGALRYEPHRLAKSSIFAAYCAHGTVPVCFSPGEADGLVPGQHYIDPRNDGSADPASIQNEALAWYAPHSVGEATGFLHGVLTDRITRP